MTTTGTVETEPEVIKAIPLRHYGRWIAAAIVIILVGLFIYGAATNDAYDWSTYRKYLFDQRISQAAVVTLELTVLAMIVSIILGVTLAVMRLSPNRC
jgi:polar amino acid transport system permease protein